MSRARNVGAAAVAVAIALAVTSCSAGGQTNASSPAAPTASTVVVTATVGPFVPRKVIIVGDSISVASETAYRDALPLDQLDVVATSGIRLGAQRDAIDLAVATNPDVLVIELGTNDVPVGESDLLDQVDEVLAETAALPCVRWVTVFVPDHEEEVAALNDHLHQAAESQANLELIDWFQMYQDDPGLMSGDGLHPNADGSAALAKAVAESTTTCA